MTPARLGRTRILVGDALARLRDLPSESVQCVVTSPPYWGLRDYGTGTWEGGDPACEHKIQRTRHATYLNGRGETGSSCTSWAANGDPRRLKQQCRCGALRRDAQLGLEDEPAAYVAAMVEIFAEVRRVLRKDGTCFVNMGDCYATRPPGNRETAAKSSTLTNPERQLRVCTTARGDFGGLKPKDLVGMPWRVAFALQAAGWWLRSDIVWHKPNPMPESVRDRPTKSHEFVFLLAKAERYFFDAEAIAEPVVYGDHPRNGTPDYLQQAPGQPAQAGITKRRRSGNKERKLETPSVPNDHRGCGVPWEDLDGRRNARTVWTIPTQPFPGAHFATFPAELARRCIAAGSSERGACPKCGAPWARVVVASGGTIGCDWGANESRDVVPSKGAQRGGTERARKMQDGTYRRETTGWRPTCDCRGGGDAEIPYAPVPCVVLDPFGGSGTTALVANGLGRDAILIELSPEYVKLAEARLRDAFGMFAEIERR